METEIIITESGQVLVPRGTDMSKEDLMQIVKQLTDDAEDIGRVEQFLDGADKMENLVGEFLCG
jgi:hypothetical protein